MEPSIWLKLLRLYGHAFPIHKGKARLAKFAYHKLPKMSQSITADVGNAIALELWPWLWSDFCTYAIGSPEIFHLNYFKSKLNKQSVVLDIGAYIGIYALNASKIATNGTVHAFEPNPYSAKRVGQAIKQNGLNNLFLSPCAVGEEEGQLELMPHEYPPASSLQTRTYNADNETISVPVITIDNYCQTAAIPRVHFMKIDVEGAELKVLKGARETLITSRPELIIELHGQQIRSFQDTVQDVVSFLQDQMDYCLFYIRAGWLQTQLHPFHLLPIHEQSRAVVIAQPK